MAGLPANSVGNFGSFETFNGFLKKEKTSKKAFSKGLWIRHVKGHSNHEWNNVADKLAGDGNFKRRTHCGPPWTLGPLVGGH